MIIQLPKDLLSETYTKPRVFLCQTSNERIGELAVTNLKGIFKWNSYHEITFDVHRTQTDSLTGAEYINPYFDLAEGLRVVNLEGFGYFQIQDPSNNLNGFEDVKSLTAYSREYELSQKYLENFIINKGTTGSMDGIQLYNATDPTHSLLNLTIMEKFPDWKIGHVDDKLATQRRSFEEDRISVYDFLMNKVCETFKCVIVFDTKDRTINVYEEETAGTETDVMISFENLASSFDISYNTDEIKTVLTVTGADDLTIRDINFGLPYIVDLSYYHDPQWMGQDLYDKYQAYLDKTKNLEETYSELLAAIKGFNISISELKNRQSTVLIGDVLNEFYSPFLSDFYQEIHDINGVVTKESYVATKEFVDELLDSLKYKEIVVEETGETISTGLKHITERDWATFRSAIESNDNSNEEKEQAIKDILRKILGDYDGDTETKVGYGLSELKVGLDARTGTNAAQAESGWSEESHKEYHRYYANYVLMKAVEAEKAVREAELATQEDALAEKQRQINELTADIAIDKHFSLEDRIRLSPFLREDEYQDDCFVVTDIDTVEEIAETREALKDAGEKELAKLCKPQLSFNTKIANLFALPEFQPIQSQFQLGNMIKIKIREGYMQKSRLIQVDIDFENLNSLTVKFGDLLSTRTQADIHADLLAQSVTVGKQVANNASYWQKGSDAATDIQNKISQGLLDAATEIKSIDGTQNVSIDQYGIHLRTMNENGSFDPKQGWIVSNKFLYTDNDWKSTKSVFGEFSYDVNGDGISETLWGILADALIGGYIEGSKIVGGTINIGDGTFVVDENGRISMFAGNIGGSSVEDVEASVNNSKYRIEVETQGPRTMTQYGQSATMTCRVYYGDEDKTSDIAASAFKWIRKSDDAAADEIWNAAHIGIKGVTVDNRDILNNATFSCEVEIKKETE